MGLNKNTMRYMELLKCFYGVNFESTAMLGRQWIHVSDNILSKLYTNIDDIRQEDGYSEKFFRYLGAKSVVSYDYSDYENCTYVHDFNEEIGSEHEERYSVVFDGGSLEHIFNFPIAIHNLMKMVKVGGYLIIDTPSNNYYDHGLYQFSPDIYWSVLNKNGFRIKDMTWVEHTVVGHHDIQVKNYKMYTPVSIRTANYAVVRVTAQKIERTPLKINKIQQSAYEAIWKDKKIRGMDYVYYDIERELNHIKGIKENKKKKIVFWGMGNDFKEFFENQHVEKHHKILGCIDSDIKKQGQRIYNIDIIGIDIIDKLLVDYFVISTSKYYEEIKKKLIDKYNISIEQILSLEEYKYYLGDCIFINNN